MPKGGHVELLAKSVDPFFDEAVELLALERIDVVYLVEGDEQLAGVVTRSDLFRAVDAVVASPPSPGERAPVKRFMTPNPMAITVDDSPAIAAELMWSRGLKALPVVVSSSNRRLVGCIRAESVMHAVSRELNVAQRAQPAALGV